MNLVVIALLALVGLSAVCAQDMNKIQDCLRELDEPCPLVNGSVDQKCLDATKKYNECLLQQTCAQRIQTVPDFADCLRSCKTGFTQVDDYINEAADCLTSYSNLNTFSVILALFLIMV